jgi:hypothetical protein
LVSLLWWGELAVEWWVASGSGTDLADLPPGTDVNGLSVIIPARNEEKNIETALKSLLSALPPRSEAILVNDRSTDRTLAIADRLKKTDARLKVIDIKSVTEGWLGKTHAMQAGYCMAGGDYLLFTDADVIFKPGCLSKAVNFCRTAGVDHLVATPRMITCGFWERVFVSFFSISLVSRFRLWRASISGSRFYAGIGAFNLVSRKAYEKAGTHRAVRSEVVDDLQLGRLLKSAGAKQVVVAGERCLQVRWNEGLGGLIAGLEKNAYAGFDYSPLLTIAGLTSVLAGTLLPAALPMVFLIYPAPGLIFPALAGSGVWLSFLVLYGLGGRGTGAHWLYFLTFPLGAVLLTWAILRSMVYFHLRGGVKWRGTVYRNPRSKI